MTRTQFTLPAAVEQAFTAVYGEGADDEEVCQAFASRWSGLDLDATQRAFESGQGDDKKLAIFALGAIAIPEATETLFAILTGADSSRMERWTSAICLGRMKEPRAFPLLEALLLDGTSLEENLKASQEADDHHRYELSWCHNRRSSLLHYLEGYHSPSLVSTVSQTFKALWDIQRLVPSSDINIWCYDELAYTLGMRGAFETLAALHLPPTHEKVAMVFMALGHLHAQPSPGRGWLGEIISNDRLKQDVAVVLAQRFQLTEEQLQDCINNVYEYSYARKDYGKDKDDEDDEEDEDDEDYDEDDGEGSSQGERITPIVASLLCRYQGHQAKIHSFSWSSDGMHVVSGSEDTTAQVWHAITGETLVTFREHEASVNAVAWSPLRDCIASGGNDNRVYTWDATTGKKICACLGHTAWICSLSWSPDGTRLASASLDKTVRVWDASSGEMLLLLRGHEGIVYSVAWSPDGASIASGGGYPEGLIYLWNAHTGEQEYVYRHHAADEQKKRLIPQGEWDEWEEEWFRGPSSVSYLQWAPHGRWLASAGPREVRRVWDPITGEDMATFDRRTSGPLTWSHDGTGLFYVPINDGTPREAVDHWSITTNELLARYQFEMIRYNSSFRSAHHITLLEVSPNGKFFATNAANTQFTQKLLHVWRL